MTISMFTVYLRKWGVATAKANVLWHTLCRSHFKYLSNWCVLLSSNAYAAIHISTLALKYKLQSFVYFPFSYIRSSLHAPYTPADRHKFHIHWPHFVHILEYHMSLHTYMHKFTPTPKHTLTNTYTLTTITINPARACPLCYLHLVTASCSLLVLKMVLTYIYITYINGGNFKGCQRCIVFILHQSYGFMLRI